MLKQFFVDGPLLPHDPPVTGYFKRTDEFDTISNFLRTDGRAAIWAPRYSGRTSFLYYLEERLGRADELGVYVSPEEHLNLSSREALFLSLASHISSRLGIPINKVEADGGNWDKPDALTRFVRGILKITDTPRLSIVVDDCDKLLSSALVTLLRFIRSIDILRRQDRIWQRLAFVVAGSVSFRSFKLLEPDELSPFETWKSCHLRDLSSGETVSYLSEAFLAANVHISQEAIGAVAYYGRGELRTLNLLGQKIVEQYGLAGIPVEADAVVKIAKDFVLDYGSDPSIAYMLSVIAHDPRCLQVVERFLLEPEKEEVPLSLDDLYLGQREHFEISNQELSGGFILDDESGTSARWLIRNHLRGEILRRHFSTRRLSRALLDLGQYAKAGPLVKNRLANELEKEFRDNILYFDESAVRDVVEWFWSSGGGEAVPQSMNNSRRVVSVDRVTAGFEAISFVLERIFGIEVFTLYEVDTRADNLIANEFLPGRKIDRAGSGKISLNDSRVYPLPQEVRAYSAKVYTVEIEEHAWLKVSIPLKNVAGEVTGILSLRTERYVKEDWATLFVRVPLIERCINSIWRLLSRYERDQYKGLSGATPIISIQFNTDSYRHFKRNIARFPEDLPVRFLEFKKGIILNEIIRAIKSSRSLMIFDLSRINNNVLFELGLAIGLNRPGLPIREQGRELNLVPLEGLIRESYRIGRILGESFFDQLREHWANYQINRDDANFVHLLNDEISSDYRERGSPFLLVIDHNRYGDAKEYRRAIERSAKRSGLGRVVYMWQGGSGDDRFTQDVRVEDTTILLAIYKLVHKASAVVARIEKIQDEDHYALRFLVTGIAMGLAKKQDRENLVLTARRSSREGRTISLPGDFNGCDPIHFDPDNLGEFVDDVATDLGRITAIFSLGRRNLAGGNA